MCDLSLKPTWSQWGGTKALHCVCLILTLGGFEHPHGEVQEMNGEALFQTGGELWSPV